MKTTPKFELNLNYLVSLCELGGCLDALEIQIDGMKFFSARNSLRSAMSGEEIARVF